MRYGRRNFLVPLPAFASFDALNAYLEDKCLERMDARLRGHKESIGERLERDLGALLALPAGPYDASDKHAIRVSSQSLVRYRTNDYSVPVAFGHRDVLVRGYVDEVVISCGTEVIARHRREYEHDHFVFNPLHYLALLEQKTGALDQAAPLAGWDLPEEYGRLRRLQESRMGRTARGSSCGCSGCLRPSPLTRCMPPCRMPLEGERPASTRSSICCCAGSRDGRQDSSLTCILTSRA